MKLLTVGVVALVLFAAYVLAVPPVQARDTVVLSLSVVDPVGDHTGPIDVVKMVLLFENVTGEYEIILSASATNPFIGEFRININLFNQDLGTTTRPPSMFSDCCNDFVLDNSTTIIKLSGTWSYLSVWGVGDRVFTNSLEGTGNPDGLSLFRSSVTSVPFGFLTNEDFIAFEETARPALVSPRGADMPPRVAIASPADGALLDTTSAFVSGTALDDVDVNKVELSTDGMTWVPAMGTTSWSDTVTLAEGPNTIFARATDTAGNTETANITVTVDTVVPMTSFNPVGILGESGWYRSAVTVTLTASDLTSDVTSTAYRIDGGGWQEYASPFTVEGDGVQTVEYNSTDVAGNEEMVNSFEVKIDTTPPTLSIPSPAAGTFLPTADVEVTWTATDVTSGIDHFEVVIDGGIPIPVALPATATSHNFTGVPDGARTVTITAFDVAGNSVILSVDLTVDTNILSLTGPYGSGPLIGTLVGIIAAAVAGVAFLLWRRRSGGKEKAWRPPPPVPPADQSRVRRPRR